MRIEYSKHFWEQFEYRKKVSPINLSLELIKETIKNPDFIVSDKNNPKREMESQKN